MTSGGESADTCSLDHPGHSPRECAESVRSKMSAQPRLHTQIGAEEHAYTGDQR